MNYRHAYHAGNFADVLKHAVLVLCIEHMKRKEAGFRVIDTHAGPGRYRLLEGDAAKTGEWKLGIGRLMGAEADPLPEPVAKILAAYLDLIRRENAGGDLSVYPGSPLIAAGLLRRGDALIANELHPDDNKALAKLLDEDRRSKVMKQDGWSALKALLPPKERRGVILIDPPFEEPGELIRLTEGLAAALRRFSTGTYILWYPIKDPKIVARFHRALSEAALPKLLKVELMLRLPRNPDVLNGTGLIVANPPFTLEADLEAILPLLADRFQQGPGGGWRLEWLSAAGA
jgi:23S rRNA (adenine2030-N6)-methyltransferase